MVTTNLRNLTNAPVDTARTDTRQPANGQRQDHGDNTRRVSMGHLSNMPPSFAAQQRAAGGRPRNRTAPGANASAHPAHASLQNHAMPFMAQIAPSVLDSAEQAEQYEVTALGPLTDDPMIGMTGHAGPVAEAPPGVDPDEHRVGQELVQHMTRKIGQTHDQMIETMKKSTEDLKKEGEDD